MGGQILQLPLTQFYSSGILTLQKVPTQMHLLKSTEFKSKSMELRHCPHITFQSNFILGAIRLLEKLNKAFFVQSQMALDKFEAERALLDGSLRSKDSELAMVKRRNDDLCKAQSRSEARIAQLKGELTEANREKPTLAKRVVELEAALVAQELSYTSDRQGLISELARFNKLQSEITEAHTELKRELAEAKILHIETQAEVKRLNFQAAHYEDKLSALKAENEELKTQLYGSKEYARQLVKAKDLAEQRLTEIDGLQAKLAQDADRARRVEDTLSKDITYWKEQNSLFKGKAARIETELKETSADLKVLKLKYEEQSRLTAAHERELKKKQISEGNIQPSLERISFAFTQLSELLREPNPLYQEMLENFE